MYNFHVVLNHFGSRPVQAQRILIFPPTTQSQLHLMQLRLGPTVHRQLHLMQFGDVQHKLAESQIQTLGTRKQPADNPAWAFNPVEVRLWITDQTQVEHKFAHPLQALGDLKGGNVCGRK